LSILPYPSELDFLSIMRLRFVLALLVSLASWTGQLSAQDLAPRAYVITPVHSNAITITWAFYDGGLNFNGTIPVTNATGTYYVSIFTYSHSLNFFGRTANITASLTYGVGTFQGDVSEQSRSVYRSGLLDSSFRCSVNLIGGPAMQPKEYAKWKQKRLLGLSLKMVAPTGQYSSTKLIQWPQRSEYPSSGLKAHRLLPQLGRSMAMRECGSTPQTRHFTMARSPNPE
jgi:hypothetical protein